MKTDRRIAVSSSVFAELCAILICSPLAFAGCGKTPEPVVVGVNDAALYKDSGLKESALEVSAGTQVEVLEIQDEAAKVSVPEGQQGWILRYQLCHASAFEERKARGHVPHRTVSVGYDENGFFVYRGTLPIRNNRGSFEPGQGIWCDSSVAGHNDFSVGGTQLTRKADVLYYITPEATIVELPILPTSSQ